MTGDLEIVGAENNVHHIALDEMEFREYFGRK